MVCGFAEHVDGRLAYLKAELKLTDSQTGAWNAFADAWRATAQKAKQKCDAADMRADNSKPAVLNKLSMMENHMVDHLEVVRAQKATIESLFTNLSDEQKKTANETLTGIMKVGMSMGDMMGGGMAWRRHDGRHGRHDPFRRRRHGRHAALTRRIIPGGPKARPGMRLM